MGIPVLWLVHLEEGGLQKGQHRSKLSCPECAGDPNHLSLLRESIWKTVGDAMSSGPFPLMLGGREA